MTLNEIPAMTDPLGKHWRQPRDIREASMDETHVLLNVYQCAELLKYDNTMPSGVYPGKVWMRREPACDYLVWYGEETERGCQVCFRQVVVVD